MWCGTGQNVEWHKIGRLNRAFHKLFVKQLHQSTAALICSCTLAQNNAVVHICRPDSQRYVPQENQASFTDCLEKGLPFLVILFYLKTRSQNRLVESGRSTEKTLCTLMISITVTFRHQRRCTLTLKRCSHSIYVQLTTVQTCYRSMSVSLMSADH